MAFRRSSQRFQRGPRRATDWSASGATAGGVAVAGNTQALLEVFTPIVGGETLIRTRGLITISTDQTVADEVQIGAIGIGVVTAQAVSVGITAIPHPMTDAGWGGWLWHSYYSYDFAFATAVGFEGNLANQIPVDSKAMRKVDEDERLVLVIQNQAVNGIILFSSLRLLSKIH